MTEYEGISIPAPASPQSTSINETIAIPSSPSHEHFQVLDISSDTLNYDDMIENTNIELFIIDEKSSEKSNKENVLAKPDTVKPENVPSTSKPEKRKRSRVKPLSGLAQNLINVAGQSTENQTKFLKLFQNFAENYKSLEKEKLNLERERLNFEIKKFKFLNPDFNT